MIAATGGDCRAAGLQDRNNDGVVRAFDQQKDKYHGGKLATDLQRALYAHFLDGLVVPHWTHAESKRVKQPHPGETVMQPEFRDGDNGKNADDQSNNGQQALGPENMRQHNGRLIGRVSVFCEFPRGRKTKAEFDNQRQYCAESCR
jgi:hypothetical protein